MIGESLNTDRWLQISGLCLTSTIREAEFYQMK